MPRGDKSKYTDKQKRQAEHIEEGYEDKGVSKKEAKSRAWATVNKESGGGKKSGSGRGKKENHSSSRKGGKKDDDNGTVTLRLREPGDDEGDKHKIFTVYVSRDTEDDDVIAVGTYLRKLVDKHYKETPNF